MGTPLSPEQTLLLKECQEKWLRIALSTEPIDHEKAREAVKQAYQVNGFTEPKIYVLGSPFAGMQKIAEFSDDLEALGKGLNQEIHRHNEWSFACQAEVSEYISAQITQPLSHLSLLFRPLGRDLEETLLYRPKSEHPPYQFPQPGDSEESMLYQYDRFMQAVCAMPRGLFYNTISTGSLADSYCRWDFGFSILGWEHSAEKWAASSALLENGGWIIPFEKICVVCDRPSKLFADDLNRLHAVGEPAIAFRDGYRIYVHHGELLGNDLTELTPQDYSDDLKPLLRQAIVEQTPVEILPMGWLFQESNWAVRQLLLGKLGHQRVSSVLQIESIGFSGELSVGDLDSMLWLVRSLVENRDDLHIKSAIAAVQSLDTPDINKLGAIRETLLIRSLERIMVWLEANAPSSAAAFAPGLQPEQIRSKLDALPFKISEEVYDLYCWRDGTDREIHQGLFIYHAFMPLEVAIEYAGYINEDDWDTNRQIEGEPKYLFPIFDLEGEYLAVVGSDTGIAATSPVYHFGSDCGDVSLAFNSLTAMLLTISEAYEMGAYTIDTRERVEWSDIALFGEISRKYNVDPTAKLFMYS
jgi:hypothetical protein